jgi:site-specific DNA-methyltransferase (adenine-specific)
MTTLTHKNLEMGCHAKHVHEWIPTDRMHRLCITSPPYWMLRDYGHPNQIGLEPTPELYIESLAQCFKSAWNRITGDGSLVIIIGDSYFGGGSSTAFGNDHANFADKSTLAGTHPGGSIRPVKPQKHPRFKVGEQIGIPWMLANALRDCGWMVRQVSIWNKPNPMPAPFRKRLTSSHEYVLHLTKSTGYYCSDDAFMEGTPDGGTRIKRDVLTLPPSRGGHKKNAGFPEELVRPFILALTEPGDLVLDPFFGSGTVGRVCQCEGRIYTGCDLMDKRGAPYYPVTA